MSTNKTYDLTNNYINIQGWMVERLNLKGNELLLYALIFGFCQDGNSRFTGSLKYMCHWTGLSEQGVRNTLKSLVEKNLLNRYEIYKQNVMFVEYVVTNLTPPQKIIPPLKNDIETPSKNLGGEVKKFGVIIL